MRTVTTAWGPVRTATLHEVAATAEAAYKVADDYGDDRGPRLLCCFPRDANRITVAVGLVSDLRRPAGVPYRSLDAVAEEFGADGWTRHYPMRIRAELAFVWAAANTPDGELDVDVPLTGDAEQDAANERMYRDYGARSGYRFLRREGPLLWFAR